MDAQTARELPDALVGLLAAFGDGTGAAQLTGQAGAAPMAAEDDDLLGGVSTGAEDVGQRQQRGHQGAVLGNRLACRRVGQALLAELAMLERRSSVGAPSRAAGRLLREHLRIPTVARTSRVTPMPAMSRGHLRRCDYSNGTEQLHLLGSCWFLEIACVRAT